MNTYRAETIFCKHKNLSLWAHFIRSCLSIFIVNMTWKSRGASSLFAIAEMRKCGIHAWIHLNRRRTLSTRLYIARLLCLHNSFRTCDLCVFFPKQFDFSLLVLSCCVNLEYFLSVLLTVLLSVVGWPFQTTASNEHRFEFMRAFFKHLTVSHKYWSIDTAVKGTVYTLQ